MKIKYIFKFIILLLCNSFLFADDLLESIAEQQAYLNSHVSKEKSVISSVSTINWTKNTFTSDIVFDVIKSGIPLPSGKTSSINKIQMELPILIKDPLLATYIDDTNTLSDLVLNGSITIEQLTHIVDKSKQTPAFFSEGGNILLTKHNLNLNDISSLLVKHKFPYKKEIPIEETASRRYTGIVIDARGQLPIHGEFIKSRTYPCLFPKIWTTNMELIYEKNMVEPEIAKNKGIVYYSSSSIISDYKDRVGNDPLWIKAKKVYGINRCDPIISKNDYLKITSIKENLDLIKEGKIVILLDKDLLEYKVSVPEKNKNYYIAVMNLKRQIEQVIPDTFVTDGPTGLTISMQNLNFVPDSAQLLDTDKNKISNIAESIKKVCATGEYTILVEGHTADVNKPNGQMILSIERAKTIINLLIENGLDKNLFSYRGYGGTKPKASNSTPEGKAQNRRVEITVMPKSTSLMQR